MTHTDETNTKPKVGFITTLGSVLAGFFGVQSRDNWQRDAEGGSPLLFLVVGYSVVLAFVAGLIVIIKFGLLTDEALSDTPPTPLADKPNSAISQNIEPRYVAQAGLSSMEQKLMPCLSCHTPTGFIAVSAKEGGQYEPPLHGKPAHYLYNQLQLFKAHKRQHKVMQRMVKPLSNKYLWEIAVYFSEQIPVHRAFQAPQFNQARGAELALAGDKNKGIPACNDCHGANLGGAKPIFPGLAGLPYSYLIAQLNAWKIGLRQSAAPDCMAQIAQRLSPEDIQAVSAWLSAQPVEKHSKQALDISMECGAFPKPEGPSK